jgi:hypothetical protein
LHGILTRLEEYPMSHTLYDLLNRLDEAGYHYSFSRNRPDTVEVTIKFVGERVEVDVFEDGHMEVSRFLGTEDVLGGQELVYDLIEKRSFEAEAYQKLYLNKTEPRQDKEELSK